MSFSMVTCIAARIALSSVVKILFTVLASVIGLRYSFVGEAHNDAGYIDGLEERAAECSHNARSSKVARTDVFFLSSNAIAAKIASISSSSPSNFLAARLTSFSSRFSVFSADSGIAPHGQSAS